MATDKTIFDKAHAEVQANPPTIPTLTLASLSTFDPTTFELLKGTTHEFMTQTLPYAVTSLAFLSSHMDSDPCDGDDWSHALAFPLNASGAPHIEDYLTNVVKPYVTKWDKTSHPVVFDKAHNPPQRLLFAGMVWGQCLAQEFGLQWVNNPDDDFHPNLVYRGDPDHEKGRLYPWWKPAKFAHLGREDSLMHYLTVLRNDDYNRPLLVSLKEWIKQNKRKVTMRKVDSFQLWHNEHGKLDMVFLKDKGGRVLKRIKLLDIVNVQPEKE